MQRVSTALQFLSYILGGEELHPFGHLEGKAEQVIKGQCFQVLCLIIQVFVDLCGLEINQDQLGSTCALWM